VTPKLETKTTGDLRQAKADFAATFAAFREANDNRLAALEAKSTADPLLTEKVDRLNAALETQTRRVENLTLANAPSRDHPYHRGRQLSQTRQHVGRGVRLGR
jgi:hypothetical protein